jgi:hypothetical protein
MRASREAARDERGSALPLAGLALFAMLAAAAIALDGGSVFAAKSHLQKTANAAALSGATELTHTDAAVNAVIETILQDHGEASSLKSSTIQSGQTVRVNLAKPVALYFSGLFGYGTVNVEAGAAAKLVPMGGATGVAPLGIDDSIQLNYGTEYKLKVDQTGVSSGYFGVLALGGNGANTYEYNLMHGYGEEVDVGNIIDTQTGNIAGYTREGVQYRIDSSPYAPGDMSHPDDPRILLVPTYRPYDYSSNQLKHIQVTGFAYFYITAPMSSTDTSITGQFIKKTGAGSIKPGALDKGAYAIRLIE